MRFFSLREYWIAQGFRGRMPSVLARLDCGCPADVAAKSADEWDREPDVGRKGVNDLAEYLSRHGMAMRGLQEWRDQPMERNKASREPIWKAALEQAARIAESAGCDANVVGSIRTLPYGFVVNRP